MSKIKVIYALLGLCMVASGCLAVSTQTKQPKTPPQLTGVTSTSSSSLTPTNTQTQAMLPVITETALTITAAETIKPEQTRTATPTQTLTPTRLPSPTIAPTLSGGAQKDYLFELLSKNANCRLPCWWGIAPGQTMWEDAHRLMIYTGLPVYNTPLVDGTILHSGSINLNNSVYTDVNFYEKQDRVESISIRIEGYRDPALVFKFWRKYSPEQIIRDYGQPTRIMTNLFGSETGRIYYYLFLFFDDQGILAFYTGRAGLPDELNYRVCPTWQDPTWLPFLELYFQSPESKIPLEKRAELASYPKPLEMISKTTVEEFTTNVLSGAKPSCFDTLQSYWP